ncbi:hypothetical protein BJ322DRAFT_1025011 [Thelephora terrestris]|uniref:Uncharacterized protein n=1 Tax=Thelephora terrestris TaxID=56493 RepID=A0A9P6L169_9AGAM|nr:hypothetical protein BJ322DRAFT_1025011 [Thelephora terrestris]
MQRFILSHEIAIYRACPAVQAVTVGGSVSVVAFAGIFTVVGTLDGKPVRHITWIFQYFTTVVLHRSRRPHCGELHSCFQFQRLLGRERSVSYIDFSSASADDGETLMRLRRKAKLRGLALRIRQQPFMLIHVKGDPRNFRQARNPPLVVNWGPDHRKGNLKAMKIALIAESPGTAWSILGTRWRDVKRHHVVRHHSHAPDETRQGKISVNVGYDLGYRRLEAGKMSSCEKGAVAVVPEVSDSQPGHRHVGETQINLRAWFEEEEENAEKSQKKRSR